MANTVPKPPYKVAFLTPSGLISPVWLAWFNELYSRIGGAIALSNTELETAAMVDLTAVESDVADLQVDVAALEAVTSSLDQGPNL